MIKNKCKKTVSAMLLMTMIATTCSTNVFAGGEFSCCTNECHCEEVIKYCHEHCCPCIQPPTPIPVPINIDGYDFNENTKELTLFNNYSKTGPIPQYTNEIQTVTIERGVKRLVGTFQECYNLTTVTISDTVKEIGENAFADCKDLESVKIPASVTKIGAYAFKGCTSLKEVIIPDSVEEISEHAFDGCASVKDVTIGQGVEKIGKNAFANCTLLSSVTNLGKCDLLSGRKKIFDNCDCDLHIKH